jgi:hypothetical protein
LPTIAGEDGRASSDRTAYPRPTNGDTVGNRGAHAPASLDIIGIPVRSKTTKVVPELSKYEILEDSFGGSLGRR